MRCNVFYTPKVGETPLKDTRCILGIGHTGKHQYKKQVIDEEVLRGMIKDVVEEKLTNE
jgi:hypothetical protein